MKIHKTVQIEKTKDIAALALRVKGFSISNVERNTYDGLKAITIVDGPTGISIRIGDGISLMIDAEPKMKKVTEVAFTTTSTETASSKSFETREEADAWVKEQEDCHSIKDVVITTKEVEDES